MLRVEKIKRNLKISNGMYNCNLYGQTINRNYNAAINIMKMFLKKLDPV